MSVQPEWECIANLGDADPITYGGVLVYVDRTGAYPPEIEVIEEYENDKYECDFDEDEDDILNYREDKHEELHWNIYRVVLNKCTYDPETECLSDNKFHPQDSAWWAQTRKEREERPQDSGLESICSCTGIERDELIRLLCSENPLELAEGYRCIAGTHGWFEFDQSPLAIKSRQEVEDRYNEDLEHLKNINGIGRC